MTVENFCYHIYKQTFAHVLFNGVYAAHVTVRIRENPFGPEELEEAFRKFIRDTPLSNLDLTVVEDASLEKGVLLLDFIETFSDGETNSDVIPFHEDVREINCTNQDD